MSVVLWVRVDVINQCFVVGVLLVPLHALDVGEVVSEGHQHHVVVAQAARPPVGLEQQLGSLLDVARGDGAGGHGVLVVRLLDGLGGKVELETNISLRSTRALNGIDVVGEIVTQNLTI